jgi:hypothetical protein
MAHKVHPKSFRIKGTEDWNIRGFYGRKMPQYLEEDFLIFLLTSSFEAEATTGDATEGSSKPRESDASSMCRGM